MSKSLKGGLSVAAQKKLARFKEYAISHPPLTLVDQIVMRAILEPAGFAHVLVYGPSEKQLDYMESRREHLWHLLSRGSDRNVSAPPVLDAVTNDASIVLAKEAPKETVPKKRQSRKKCQSNPTDSITATSSVIPTETFDTTEALALESVPKKKSTRRVGQRQPQRDPVGS